MLHGDQVSPPSYTVEEAFGPFLRCYSARDRAADGFAFVATESLGRGQLDMAATYIEAALEADAGHVGARELREVLRSIRSGGGGRGEGAAAASGILAGLAAGVSGSGGRGGKLGGNDPSGLTPEELYSDGTDYFSQRRYVLAADAFQRSCELSEGRIGAACTNAVYCRANVLDWGDGDFAAESGDGEGSLFDRDMALVEAVTRMEAASYRTVDPATGKISWKRSTSSHPHMMLGYPVDSMLKRYVAESYAVMDELLARAVEADDVSGGVPDLPADLPYRHASSRYQSEIAEAGDAFRIRLAFVASGFNSKAVLYLSHDLFRFFDAGKFEVHVFSLGAPDNPAFIEHTMRGVDWRKRVESNVDFFHDVRNLKDDHIGLARYIHSQGIHVLIEWDGYARQGERAQGLFALRPAPVQVLHQEFLGTSGAQYVDYIVTDQVTSPERHEGLYTEKFIYLPNHFFSKGHALQEEVKKPTHDYAPVQHPYKLGTGAPQENRCLASVEVGPPETSFVFCNFNKFLKNNPETMRSWIKILQSVPDSMLCLLENPSEGVPNLRRFVREVGGDQADALNDRIHFLPWQANPFDHQMRAQDFCNVMLDSHPYNGHTTAQDSLYGGVPIVTRADGDDMSSRVTTSANAVLGLSDLNAWGGPERYEEIAINLAQNEKYFESTRKELIDTCLQKNPMHPYWDVPRYTKNLQTGLTMAWDRFLSGKPKSHLHVKENDKTKMGTYERDILQLEAERKRELEKKEIRVEL